MDVKKGSTDITVYLHLRSSADGTSKTALVYNSPGAVCSYVRTRGLRTAITLATLAAADSAHSDGGFKEVDGTNMKGLYRLDIPDAAVVTGVDKVIIHIGFTGVFEESLEIDLVDNKAKDVYDIVNHTSYGNAKLVRATTPANELAVDSGGKVTAIDIDRILGLALENHVEDDIVRDGDGNKTSCTLYCYNSAANAIAHDGSTGLVAKYNVTATYTAQRMTLFTVVKV
jgi:hypothetical protein